MVGFSEALRAEYGREGLGVTALCPGFVATNLFASAPLPENSNGPKFPPRIFCTTPEKTARAAVKAIRRNRRLVVIEPFAKVLTTIKRFAPSVIDFFLHLGRRSRIAKKMARLENERVIRHAA
jgi:short-subunit dehydrogenase